MSLLLNLIWFFNVVLLLILLLSAKNISTKKQIEKIPISNEPPTVIIKPPKEPEKINSIAASNDLKPQKVSKLTLNSNKDALCHNIPPSSLKKTNRVSIKESIESNSKKIKWIPNFNHMADLIIQHYKLIKSNSKLKDNLKINVFSYLLLHLHIAIYHYLKIVSKFQDLDHNILSTLKIYEVNGFHKLKIIPNLKNWFESLGGAEFHHDDTNELIKFIISLPQRKEPMVRNPYPETINFNSPKGKTPVENYDINNNDLQNFDFYLHIYSQIQAILDGYYSHTTTEIFPNFSAILLASWFVFSTNSIDKRRFISANNIKELKYLDQGNVRISFMNIVGGNSIDFEKIDESFAYLARDTLIDFNGKDDIHDDIKAYLNVTPRLLKHLKEVSIITENVAEYIDFETGIWDFQNSLLNFPLFTNNIKMIKPGIRSLVLNEMSLQEYSTFQEVIAKFEKDHEREDDVISNEELFYDSITTGLIWDNSKGITPGFFYKDDKFYYYDRRKIDSFFKQGTLYHSEIFQKDLITSEFSLRSA
ncbi:putative membrane protein [Wickerhamomyces ciferrii]|uniref:Membrane protein n=1 Tax=Wickerhamomyces ciferrii (strain ATCC 14091 / BCRC 22168 / CBS 111 / JCM 3599 / NBRC 0793 / NRRL Y-1031 F-60-10) TaxID=1206466 RepID=K0KCM6_WICCF|nr:uncharacterized protein BN7_2370 [Wickerhamomyces ciferrii]CCH42825.1 putative membrane protein [Wickerhamomyces ciferrii]